MGFQVCKTKTVTRGFVCTYRVQKNSEEEFSPIDEFVQFIRTARVVFVEDSVCEKATCLPGQHLWYKQIQSHKKKKSKEKKKKTNLKDMHSQINTHTISPLLRAERSCQYSRQLPHTMFAFNNIHIMQLI